MCKVRKKEKLRLRQKLGLKHVILRDNQLIFAIFSECLFRLSHKDQTMSNPLPPLVRKSQKLPNPIVR